MFAFWTEKKGIFSRTAEKTCPKPIFFQDGFFRPLEKNLRTLRVMKVGRDGHEGSGLVMTMLSVEKILSVSDF